MALGLPRMDAGAGLDNPFGQWPGQQNAAQGLPLYPLFQFSRKPMLARLWLCVDRSSELWARSRRWDAFVRRRYQLEPIDERLRRLDAVLDAIRRALIAPAPPRWNSILTQAFQYLEYTANSLDSLDLFLKSAPKIPMNTFAVDFKPLVDALMDCVTGTKCVDGIPIGTAPITRKRRFCHIRRPPGGREPLQDIDVPIDGEGNKRQRHSNFLGIRRDFSGNCHT